MKDEEIFERAIELGRVVMTHDPVFIAMANARVAAGLRHPYVAFCIQKSKTIRQIVDFLETMAFASIPGEHENKITYIT